MILNEKKTTVALCKTNFHLSLFVFYSCHLRFYFSSLASIPSFVYIFVKASQQVFQENKEPPIHFAAAVKKKERVQGMRSSRPRERGKNLSSV